MCNNKNCISDILKAILILQKNSEIDEYNFLGLNTICNTRPVMLFSTSCNQVRIPINKEEFGEVFRIEKLDGNCATFRILISKDENYIATKKFFTIDLSHCAIIRCLSDIFIECA